MKIIEDQGQILVVLHTLLVIIEIEMPECLNLIIEMPLIRLNNRYFADWIRLCPGLSKNSENGNSCPKPHKAARYD